MDLLIMEQRYSFEQLSQQELSPELSSNAFAYSGLDIVIDEIGFSVKSSDGAQNQAVSTIVLVGQGINLWIVSQCLRDLKIQRCQVLKHDMDMQFGQQVLLVRIERHQAALSRLKLISVGAKYHVDIFNQAQTRLSQPGLLVMDMDSTIIEIECIDEIAGLAGLKDKVAEVTEQAMRGEIAFTDSLKYRVACLEGVAVEKLNKIRHRLPFNQNFLLTMQILKEKGWRLAVASGGFTFFADYVKEYAGLDYALSNELGIENGKLNGQTIGDVIDAKKKAELVGQLKEKYAFADQQCVAIGDGANDLLMMEEAGLGIAFKAKPSVQESADAAINVSNFESLLYIMQA